MEPLDDGALATIRVEMNGNKHYELLSEVIEKIGDDAFDDRGISAAIDRLGKTGRLFGRKEVRHLQHLIRGRERVAALGQGKYGDKQGLITLTNERLFFFEKSLGSETVEEFSLQAIVALETSKKLTGERLTVRGSGGTSEITHVVPGQAQELAHQFRRLRDAQAAPAPSAPSSGDDALAALEKLAALRDQGILTPDEFESKKADLLRRI